MIKIVLMKTELINIDEMGNIIILNQCDTPDFLVNMEIKSIISFNY